MSSRVSTLALVLLLVLAPVAAPIGLASTAVAQEDGMVGVPDSNVVEDLPVGENHSLTAADLEGSVMASDHASSLQVIVTTPERSSDYLNGSTVGGSSGVALVLQDDTHHEAREVGLPADAIREAVGHVPEVVRGVHESGERWTAPVEARNGMLFFEVPKFSSNSIVFDGEVRLDATATNGSTYSYNLSSTDAVDDPTVNLTGTTNSETDTVSGTTNSGTINAEISGTEDPPNTTLTLFGNGFGERMIDRSHSAVGDGHSDSVLVEGSLSDTTEADAPTVSITGRTTTQSESASWNGLANGDSTTVDVAGNTAPSGQSVTFTGEETVTSQTRSGTGETTGSTTVTVDGNADPRNSEVTFTGNTATSNGDASGTAAPGDTASITNGNIQPTGPANNEPELTLTASETYGYTKEEALVDSQFLASGGWEISPNRDMNGLRVTIGQNFYMRDAPGAQVAIVKPDGTTVAATSYRTLSQGETITLYGDLQVGSNYWVIVRSEDGSSLKGDHGDNWAASGDAFDIVSGVENGASGDSFIKFFTSVQEVQTPSGVTVSASDGSSVSFGDMSGGETTSKAFDLSGSASSMTFDYSGGSLDWSLDKTDRTATEDPSVDVDGDGTAEASYSGVLTEGQTATKSLSALSTGSNTLDWSRTAGSFDWSLSFDEISRTEDPSVDVDGDGTAEASYSGVLAPGQTTTQSVSGLSLGSNTLSVSTASGTTTGLSVSWTERVQTEGPSVTLNGVTKSHAGKLSDGETVTLSWAPSDLTAGTSNSYTLSLAGAGANAPSMAADYSLSIHEVDAAKNPSVDIDGDGSAEASYSGLLADGQSANYTIDPSLGDDSWSVSSTGSPITVSAEITETTVTVDPAVSINGHTLTHDGRLADGESVTLNGSADWLLTGTNEVVVEVGDGTLSSDAPEPKVALDYRHGASDTVIAEYASTGWRESYNVSHTYASARTGPTATVEFSREVHDIRYVETSVNGGTWSTVQSDRWELKNDTTLVVQLDDGDGDGDVEGGDEIALRTAGMKVQVANGEITVVDPTTPADEGLDAGIRVDTKRAGFGIEVGGTAMGDRLHYTHTESWTATQEYAVIEAGGSQLLRVPNAEAGDTFRVTTVPIVVEPQSGDASIHVDDPDGPTFTLVGTGEDSTNDQINFNYVGATAGETYELYSVSRGRPVAKATADGDGVVLEQDDSGETFRIRLAETSSGDGSGGLPGGGGSWDQATPDSTLQEGLVVAGWAVLVVLLVAATGRSSLRGRRRWLLVGSIGAGTGLLAIEVLRPGTISTAISGGLQEIVPLAGLAGIGIVGYSVYSWWQARKAEASTPETEVTFDLGRSGK